MSIQEYLDKGLPCTCGREHRTALKQVDIAPGAIERLPGLIQELCPRKVFLVSDENTWPVLGQRAEALLKNAGLPCSGIVLPGDALADELGIGQVLMRIDRDCGVILAIGTGTVNDIAKFVSHRMGLPYIIAATAPSMDGFASNVAAMTANRMKTTFPAHVPLAVVADLDVLCKAPMAMIAAGLGDILGKYTALWDWKLSSVATGEYYCPALAGLMREALERAASSVDGLESRSPEAIGGLTEALVLSGIAMSFAGNSRPASGSEHHISHFWEMRFIAEGRTPILHGTKVGVGTVLSLALSEKLLARQVDFAAAREHALHFDRKAWEGQVRKGFGPAAEGVLALEKTAKKNDPERHAPRLARIQENWAEIRKGMEQSLPSAQKIRDILGRLDAPVSPQALGIDKELTREAIVLAKEVRDRYTTLQLLWDLGLLEKFAAEAAE